MVLLNGLFHTVYGPHTCHSVQLFFFPVPKLTEPNEKKKKKKKETQKPEPSERRREKKQELKIEPRKRKGKKWSKDAAVGLSMCV